LETHPAEWVFSHPDGRGSRESCGRIGEIPSPGAYPRSRVTAEATIETLIDVLAYRARETPEREALVFEGETLTYGELGRRIGAVAAGLAGRGLGRGGRVVLALPNGVDFFAAFYGIQRAGGVAVPVYPDSGPRRLRRIAELCGAELSLVASAEAAARLQREGGSGGVLSVEAAAGTPPGEAMPPVGLDDVALIQYTSGSTGDPRGVQITHANLIDNLRQMIAGMGITETEVFVSWLPVCHDMGLILMTMVPFYLPARLVLLPSDLTHPRRWLAAIEEHRGTFTAAPDFAYRLCLAAIREPEKLDLSSLRVALDAAEPVRASTLAGFEAAFGLRHVMAAGYGLAEATVGVSMAPPGRPPKVDERGFVSVGGGFPGVELAVVRHRGDGGEAEGEAGGRAGGATDEERLGVGEVGEILVRSPANTRGYFANPAATARLFAAGGFLRTGDLGYLDRGGDLFIVGRTRNLIVRAGQTLAPGEVEEGVDALPFVRRSAAVGIDRGDAAGEQVYVFAEVRGGGRARRELHETWVVEIVRSFYGRFGFRPGRVYLLVPGALPRTANGKLQHPRLRQAYLSGGLRSEGKILFPEH
jgi:acyl-CoA synthetase (AMP-forming)/AMP-acid ligase II